MGKKANAVFKGGGVKGIALTGALVTAEEQGWEWNEVAGTSAGAITAALVAAGYKGSEVHDIINKLDFNNFKERHGIPIVNLLRREGLYKGDYVIKLMDDLLGQKIGKSTVTFADLPIPLHVVASDITHKCMTTFPHDLGGAPYRFAFPLNFPVAHAVRASMSIPLFFEPYDMQLPGAGNIKHATFVDGGMLSNFPVGIFRPRGGIRATFPTIGFYLHAPSDKDIMPTGNLEQFLVALMDTLLQGHDDTDMTNQDFERTMMIDTGAYGTTQFNIDQAGKDWLYSSGRQAAERFFKNPQIQTWLQNFHR